jgi:ATP-dependent Clp protease ATP-binding subunit ClpX
MSNKDVELAERGIIFMDEFDKLAFANETAERESKMAVGVQQALLRFMEAERVLISPQGAIRTAGQESVTLRTDKILFIGAGAFTGLDMVCRRRRRGLDLWTHGLASIEEEDLIEYGFLPELVARFGFLVEFDPLTTESLLKILNSQDDSPLALYRTYFQLNQVKLTFDEKALDYVAQEAQRRNLGARPLRSLLYRLLAEDVFDPPAQRTTLLITEDMARQRLSGRARFKLTDKGLASLKEEGVPEAVLTKLQDLKDKKAASRGRFLLEIRRFLGAEDLRDWKNRILNNAASGDGAAEGRT